MKLQFNWKFVFQVWSLKFQFSTFKVCEFRWEREGEDDRESAGIRVSANALQPHTIIHSSSPSPKSNCTTDWIVSSSRNLFPWAYRLQSTYYYANCKRCVWLSFFVVHDLCTIVYSPTWAICIVKLENKIFVNLKAL